MVPFRYEMFLAVSGPTNAIRKSALNFEFEKYSVVSDQTMVGPPVSQNEALNLPTTLT